MDLMLLIPGQSNSLRNRSKVISQAKEVLFVNVGVQKQMATAFWDKGLLVDYIHPSMQNITWFIGEDEAKHKGKA